MPPFMLSFALAFVRSALECRFIFPTFHRHPARKNETQVEVGGHGIVGKMMSLPTLNDRVTPPACRRSQPVIPARFRANSCQFVSRQADSLTDNEASETSAPIRENLWKLVDKKQPRERNERQSCPIVQSVSKNKSCTSPWAISPSGNL
jgi:hypothetical protein